MRLFANANYDFIGQRKRGYAITGAFIVIGLIVLLVRGVNYSVEFTGGTLIQVETERPGRRRRAARRAPGRGASTAPRSRPSAPTASWWSGPGWHARAPTPTTPRRPPRPCGRRSTPCSAPGNYTILRTEAVGPKVGGELRQQAVLAILLSFLAVLAYLAYRFEWRFGVAAVIATAHDILATHRLHRARPARGQPLRGGGAAHDRGLLAQRHDRDLRPRPREPAPAQAGELRARSSTARSTRPCRGPCFTGTTALGSLLALSVLGGEWSGRSRCSCSSASSSAPSRRSTSPRRCCWPSRSAGPARTPGAISAPSRGAAPAAGSRSRSGGAAGQPARATASHRASEGG